MRYSDVARKYYKDTKNRILENVLAAENGGERSDGRIIGERESKEKNIMTNSTAIIRNSKGIIAAACALVMLGSSTFVMHRLRASDDREVSSRPDKVKSTVVTSSDEDTSSEVNEEDNETAPDADDSTSEKSAEKKQEKKNDSGETTSAAEKADNSNVVVLKDDSAKKTDTGTNSDNSTPVSTVNDSTAAADSSSKADSNGSSADIRQADSTADIDYSLDEDNFVDETLLWEIEKFHFIGEGTITSKELYGCTTKNDVNGYISDDEYKPFTEFSEGEIDSVKRWYFRCTVKFDGKCYRGAEYMSYIAQTALYDQKSGDMIINIPVGRGYQNYSDIFLLNHIATEEDKNTDRYSVGEKVLVEIIFVPNDNGWDIYPNDIYRYDINDSMYHHFGYYISEMRRGGEYKESTYNYILNTLKGGTPEAAEQWVNYLGESYMIEYIPSMRFASGEVVSVNYSQPDGCYVIYVAE